MRGRSWWVKVPVPVCMFLCIPEGPGGIRFPLSAPYSFSLLPYVTFPAFSFLLPEVTSHINYLPTINLRLCFWGPKLKQQGVRINPVVQTPAVSPTPNNCVRLGVRNEILILVVPTLLTPDRITQSQALKVISLLKSQLFKNSLHFF